MDYSFRPYRMYNKLENIRQYIPYILRYNFLYNLYIDGRSYHYMMLHKVLHNSLDRYLYSHENHNSLESFL